MEVENDYDIWKKKKVKKHKARGAQVETLERRRKQRRGVRGGHTSDT